MVKQTIYHGFTLIELVVVMIILGIITAVAIPQYFDLRSHARIAALNGLAAAINSASELTHSKYLATGTQTNPVKVSGGITVQVATSGANEGYPLSSGGGIEYAVKYLSSSFFYTPGAQSGVFNFSPNGFTNCVVKYNGSSAVIPEENIIIPHCPRIPIGAAVVCDESC